MKVIYCIKSLAIHGGIERVISTKANWLAQNGYQVFIITTDQKGRNYSFPLNENIKHYDLGLNYQDDNVLGRLGRIKALYQKRSIHKERLEQVIKEIRPDIIISTFFEEASILPQLKDKSKKILEQHSSKYTKVLMYPKSQKLKRLFGYIRIKYETYISKKYDKLVILTNEEFPLWRGQNNVCVIPNSNPNIFKDLSSLKEHKVLAVGRFEYQKNFKELIDIWAIVHKICPDWQLDIIGGGYLQKSIKEYTKTLNLNSSINFIGTSPQVEKYYLSSSIYALSSHYEGLPMVLLEAQATGLPIVAYTCPCGPKDVVTDGEVGFLVKPNDKGTFAKRLIQLMQDEELRKQMGIKAKENSKRFEIETIMPQWIELFKSLKEE